MNKKGGSFLAGNGPRSIGLSFRRKKGGPEEPAPGVIIQSSIQGSPGASFPPSPGVDSPREASDTPGKTLAEMASATTPAPYEQQNGHAHDGGVGSAARGGQKKEVERIAQLDEAETAIHQQRETLHSAMLDLSEALRSLTDFKAVVRPPGAEPKVPPLEDGEDKIPIEDLVGAIRSRLEDLRGRAVGKNRDTYEDLLALLEVLEKRVNVLQAAAAGSNAEPKEVEVPVDLSQVFNVGNEIIRVSQEVANGLQRTEGDLGLLHESLLKKVNELSPASRPSNSYFELQALLNQTRRESEAKTFEIVRLRELLQQHQPLKNEPAPQLTIVGECKLGDVLAVSMGNTSLAGWQFQWSRLGLNDQRIPIAGATREVYSPEPHDVSYVLQCELVSPYGQRLSISTPIDIQMDVDLVEYVQASYEAGGGAFNVVIVQVNGDTLVKQELYTLEVLQQRVKIRKGKKTKYKERYTEQMLVCGARGGGDAAAQGLFLALRPNLVLMLACETARDRNAALMLIRMMAKDSGVSLSGPEDTRMAGGFGSVHIPGDGGESRASFQESVDTLSTISGDDSPNMVTPMASYRPEPQYDAGPMRMPG